MPLCYAAVDPYCSSYHSGNSANLCSCYSCYSILSIVFLSSCHSWFLTTLGFYCLMASDHCLFSGCCLVGFVLSQFFFKFSFSIFFMINYWLTLCVIHSAFVRKNIDLFIQSLPLLLGIAHTLGTSLLQPGLWVLELFWEGVVVGTDSVRIIKATNTECL